MIRTLVIHPSDKTTDFLSVIYADRGWTVINTNVSKRRMVSEIKSHDRIVMLGHGSEQGLFGFGRIVVDSKLVYLLRTKDCVCIWCNADKFVEKYSIRGFYTGMIISDNEEANLYCVMADLKDIEQSNALFADAAKKSIDYGNMLKVMEEHYVGDNPVINFNKVNLFQV